MSKGICKAPPTKSPPTLRRCVDTSESATSEKVATCDAAAFPSQVSTRCSANIFVRSISVRHRWVERKIFPPSLPLPKPIRMKQGLPNWSDDVDLKEVRDAISNIRRSVEEWRLVHELKTYIRMDNVQLCGIVQEDFRCTFIPAGSHGEIKVVLVR